MNTPNSRQIDLLRKAGLRPQVVAYIIRNGEFLLTYSRQHNLWFVPQGGIDNKESPEKALYRELGEELGIKLQKSLYGKPEIIHTDKIMFTSGIGSRDLRTDAGESVVMKGKYYLHYIVQSNIDKINVKDTEFDKLIWIGKDKLYIVPKIITVPTKKNQFINVMPELEKYLT
jgi:putative (di)nucleoside polyphosphate hydrolase